MARGPTQLFLSGFEGLGTKAFGGSLLKGNPREARPISLKRPMHLVMRSSLASGRHSLLARARTVESLVRSLARRSDVRVYRFANGGNHLHMIILPRSREGYRGFIRGLSGVLTRLIMGAEYFRPRGTRFWDARPFTRILEWGRDYRAVCLYLVRNTLEALGFIPYLPRTRNSRPPPRNGQRNASRRDTSVGFLHTQGTTEGK